MLFNFLKPSNEYFLMFEKSKFVVTFDSCYRFDVPTKFLGQPWWFKNFNMVFIYLFEILIEDLIFTDDDLAKLNCDVIKIKINCGDVIILVLEPVKGQRPNKQDLRSSFSAGKSMLFPSSLKHLVTLMQSEKIFIELINDENDHLFGDVTITWSSDFIKFVKDNENPDKKGLPVQESNTYDILATDKSRNKVGTLNVFLCLNCFGSNIEVDFQALSSNIDVIKIKRRLKASQLSEIEKKFGSEEIAEPWSPVFFSPFLPKRSVMEPEMRVFAQLVGIIPGPTRFEQLTPEYINAVLCGHKTCPGAQRFKDFGLGPLAVGSGVGTVEMKNVKPSGLYGMSQSYGSLENYGAYGFFVKGSEGIQETCGSRFCPYKICQDYLTTDKIKQKPKVSMKKCVCACCKGNEKIDETCGGETCPYRPESNNNVYNCAKTGNGKNQSDNCGGETCLFNFAPPTNTCACCQGKENKDSYNKTDNCGGETCPFRPETNMNVFNCAREENSNNTTDNCGSKTCLLNFAPSINKCGCCQGKENKNKSDNCKGETCPFRPVTAPTHKCTCCKGRTEKSADYCTGQTCPFRSAITKKASKVCSTCGKVKTSKNNISSSNIEQEVVKEVITSEEETAVQNISPRQSAGADKYDPCGGKPCPLYFEETRKRRFSNTEGVCGGKPCPFTGLKQPEVVKEVNNYSEDFCGSVTCQPLEETITVDDYNSNDDPCGGVICSFGEEENNGEQSLEGGIHCGDEQCPYGEPLESTERRGSVSERRQRFSLDLAEKGDQYRTSIKSDLLSREFFSSLSFGDDVDIFLLLGQMALQNRQMTHSMNNYYEMSDDPLLSLDLDTNVALLNELRMKHKASCSRNTCKVIKYKTCSECGGISRSGATCDNTDVSFDTLSYDDYFDGDSSVDVVKNPRQEEKSKEVKENTTQRTPYAKPEKSDDPPVPKVPKKQRKRRSRFTYREGERYPGIQIGHKVCNTPTKNVPAQMGWLWNLEPQGRLRKRRGWRPGALGKTIYERIVARRRERGIPDPPELKMLVAKRRTRIKQLYEESSSDEEILPKPTLTIQKKDGSYLITMNPLKDPRTLAEHENPYMDCAPMQFVITKNKPETKAPAPQQSPESDESEADVESEYGTYYKDCYCDEDLKLLGKESSSSESELNIEFTTPAGLIIPERMKRSPNIVHTDTQFKEVDFTCSDCNVIIPTKFKAKKKTRGRAGK